jgi:hypothetical protein
MAEGAANADPPPDPLIHIAVRGARANGCGDSVLVIDPGAL